MKLGLIRRISKEDLGKEPPGWVDGLLSALNPFIDQVVVALQGRLNFEDNFASRVASYDLTHDTELEINPQVPGRVTGAFPVFVDGAVLTGWAWSHKQGGNIGLKVRFDSGGSTKKAVKWVILWG
jgi:hypothetical protein